MRLVRLSLGGHAQPVERPTDSASRRERDLSVRRSRSTDGSAIGRIRPGLSAVGGVLELTFLSGLSLEAPLAGLSVSEIGRSGDDGSVRSINARACFGSSV